jgi:hypothetical protein
MFVNRQTCESDAAEFFERQNFFKKVVDMAETMCYNSITNSIAEDGYAGDRGEKAPCP